MLSLKQLKYYLPILPALPGLYRESKIIRKSMPKMENAADLSGTVFKKGSDLLNILFVGESTISGVGVKSNTEGFSGALSKIISDKLNKTVNWQVFAKSGFNVKRIAEEIIPAIPENKVDLIFIGIGGNDAFELTHPDTFKINVLQLISNLKIKFPITPLVFINFPAVEDFPALTPKIKSLMISWVKYLHQEMLTVSKDDDQVYFDPEIITFSSWKEKLNLEVEVSELFSDGIHPSKLSYELWAQIVAEFTFNKTDLIKSLK